MELVAIGLMGTAFLIFLKDIYEPRPGTWLESAERLLRGKIHVARTQSEIDSWIKENNGTAEITDEQRAAVSDAVRKAQDESDS